MKYLDIKKMYTSHQTVKIGLKYLILKHFFRYNAKKQKAIMSSST